MGTTGSGKFSDYPGSAGGRSSSGGGQPSGSGMTGSGGVGSLGGPGGGPDLCDRAIPNIALEEVPRCDYFLKFSRVPATGTVVNLRQNLANKRLAIEDATSHEIIGYLPTQFNYLIGCMQGGKRYEGNVISSGLVPYARVSIDLAPV